MAVKGDEVEKGDRISGRVVVKVKRARRGGPVTLTHKDGYTEITRLGMIQVERMVEDEQDTGNGRDRREEIADGDTEQRDTRIRLRPERRTRREISGRANRGGSRGSRNI